MIAKLMACRALPRGAREVFVADGRDAAGLAVLARHGRKAGAAEARGSLLEGGQTARSQPDGREAARGIGSQRLGGLARA
jgi:hypothetical protein